MRELKFRAWDKKTNQWRYGGTQPYYGDKPYTIIYLRYFWEFVESGDFKNVCQYTGLKDKNGVEIYEGNILLIPDEYTDRILEDGSGPIETMFHLSVVEFSDGSFGVAIKETGDIYQIGFHSFVLMEDAVSDLGVIGNIYENPELLKEGGKP